MIQLFPELGESIPRGTTKPPSKGCIRDVLRKDFRETYRVQSWGGGEGNKAAAEAGALKTQEEGGRAEEGRQGPKRSSMGRE